MKSKIEYKDAPFDMEKALDKANQVADFLPPPDQLVEKIEKEKITISLNKRSVEFFRKAADEEGVGYQTMINNLLEKYVQHYKV